MIGDLLIADETREAKVWIVRYRAGTARQKDRDEREGIRRRNRERREEIVWFLIGRLGCFTTKAEYKPQRLHRLNTPLLLRRLKIGFTITNEILNPTVRPIATDMSCKATWKPDR